MSDTGESPKASAPAPAGGRKPVILAVDDEPQVLNAVALDLRRRFRGDYRILTAASGAEALDATRKLRQRGDLVALFLVDQRMPSMSASASARRPQPVGPIAAIWRRAAAISSLVIARHSTIFEDGPVSLALSPLRGATGSVSGTRALTARLRARYPSFGA